MANTHGMDVSRGVQLHPDQIDSTGEPEGHPGPDVESAEAPNESSRESVMQLAGRACVQPGALDLEEIRCVVDHLTDCAWHGIERTDLTIDQFAEDIDILGQSPDQALEDQGCAADDHEVQVAGIANLLRDGIQEFKQLSINHRVTLTAAPRQFKCQSSVKWSGPW